jgi:hypothetical protein
MNDQSNITPDTRHIIAYVQRSKITDWKRLMDPGAGQPFPFIYGSRDRNVFAKYVNAGAVLWVFSATPDGRPPSLVAKLHVIGRADDPSGETYGVPPGVLRAFRKEINGRRQFNYIAVGHPTLSRFYGYNNASQALLSLTLKWVYTSRTLSGEAPCPQGTCTWHTSFAAPLNRPALVVSDPKPLEDLDHAATHSIFISWKRWDNRKRREDVRALIYALADQGLFAWLDVFAFPPSIALTQKVDPKADLVSRLLRYGYQRCSGLLALETRNYGAPGILGNWTEMEWMGKFDPDAPPSPLPFRAVYRFESSPVSANLLQDNDCLLSDLSWSEAAKVIRTKMEESITHTE